jgi:predicted TIM-barrel fold metal-dependent hydrolase
MVSQQQQQQQQELPTRFFDAHHHFVDTVGHGESFQAFVGTLIPNTVYLAEDYHRDVITPIENAGVTFYGSVHMECIPDDGLSEARWVASAIQSSSASYVKAIVASCHLAQDINIVNNELEQLTKIPQVKGIRWILDCVGKFDGNTATHVATKRHDGIDYLRGSDGGCSSQTHPDFEKGFALLEKFSLSFDLQCAPVQLGGASKLCAKYPNIKVVIDHLGKPRTLLGADKDNDNTQLDDAELTVWRAGMKSMAKNDNVYVKISMLGYVIPGWIRTPERIGLMKLLVKETVDIFGPNRCMVATNFWKSASVSDADTLSDIGPEPLHFIELVYGFLKDTYSKEDLDYIFCKTAASFYGVNL